MKPRKYIAGDARTVVYKRDRAGYNAYMREYRARKKREAKARKKEKCHDVPG